MVTLLISCGGKGVTDNIGYVLCQLAVNRYNMTPIDRYPIDIHVHASIMDVIKIPFKTMFLSFVRKLVLLKFHSKRLL